MHRNTIMIVCLAFCAIAVAAGWFAAGMSGQAEVISARQATSDPIGSAATQAASAAPTAAQAPGATTAPAPTAAAPEPTSAPLPEPTAVPATPAAEPTYSEYTVKEGDILYNIALANNVTVEQIIAINQISNPESLVVGQVIRIPKT
jgi:LysM repeat protein